MNNRELGNTDPDLTISQFLSQDQSLLKHNLGQINIKHVRERFSKALNEITRLEKIIEDKNTLLTTSAKEKERLLDTLNKAINDKKRLHNKFADFDVLRNMEIAEVKQSAEKMVSKINHLRKETNELIDDIFEKDKAIEEMKYTIEKKELQLRDVQADLDVAIETLRGIESTYKEMETNYKAINQEKDALIEKLNAPIEQQNTGHSVEEYRKLLDIATSEKEVFEKRLSGLREQRTKEMSDYQATIERLTAEKDKLNLKLIEATKDVALSKEENAAIEALREIEANHKVIEQERDDLKEQLKIIVHDSIQKSEAEAEHRKNIEELNNTIDNLKITIGEKINENVSLKDKISSLNLLLDGKKNEENSFNNKSVKFEKTLQLKGQQSEEASEYQATIERLTVEKDELNKKLSELGERVTLPKEEKVVREVSSDKRLLYFKSLAERSEGRKFPEKMIYIAPSRFGRIKKILQARLF